MTWYTTSDADRKAVAEFEAQLRSSDRAAAIIGGSLVETRLTEFLRSSVQDDGKIWADRTRSSAPLGSFSMKIDLAYLMRLVTKDAHSDLVDMKTIRNKFAHDLDIGGFEAPVIKDRCMRLRLVDKMVIGDDFQMEGFGEITFRIGGVGALEELRTPRHRFAWSVRVFTMALGMARKEGPQI